MSTHDESMATLADELGAMRGGFPGYAEAMMRYSGLWPDLPKTVRPIHRAMDTVPMDDGIFEQPHDAEFKHVAYGGYMDGHGVLNIGVIPDRYR